MIATRAERNDQRSTRKECNWRDRLTVAAVDTDDGDKDSGVPSSRSVRRNDDDVADDRDETGDRDRGTARVDLVREEAEEEDREERDGVHGHRHELCLPRLEPESGDDGREEQRERVWWSSFRGKNSTSNEPHFRRLQTLGGAVEREKDTHTKRTQTDGKAIRKS